MVWVERGNGDEPGIEGFGQTIVGVAHEMFRMREAGVGIRSADADANYDGNVPFTRLERMHVEIVENPPETLRRAILHVRLDGDHRKHIRLWPSHDIEWSDQLAYLSANPGHQFVYDALFVLFFDHTQIVDANKQQTGGPASGLGVFNGV